MSDNILDYNKLCSKADGLSYKEIIPLLDKMENMNVDQLRKVVDFTFRQYSFWDTEWAFSLADNPNNLAHNESKEWEKISDTFRKLLIETIPTIKELVDKQQQYILLQYVIQSRINYNKTRPIERTLTSIMAHTSFFVKRIGLNSVGIKLYKNSLYPKGTIGRIT